MSSKPYILASLLLLAACSGSSSSIDAFARPGEEPTKFVTTAPDGGEPAKLAPTPDATTTPDADSGDVALDADVPDSDAGTPDSGQDADAEAEAPTPRFGVKLNGDGASAVTSPMPADIGGQASLTLETWYRLDATSDRGAFMSTPFAYCAVTTGGPATIHCCAHDNSGQACVVSPVVAGQGVWYHVAWVLSSGSWTLFVNGQKQGDAASPFQAHPAVASGPGIPASATHLFLGAERVINDHASFCTVDEFRLTYSALYTGNFTPPKHLDAAGRLNLLLDEGTGATSGSAALYGAATWVNVSR